MDDKPKLESQHKEESQIEVHADQKAAVPGMENSSSEQSKITRKTSAEEIRELEAMLDLADESLETEHPLEKDATKVEQIELTAPQNNSAEDLTDFEFLIDPTEATSETDPKADTVQESQVTENGLTKEQGIELDPNGSEKKPTFDLVPSLGVVDFSKKYKAVIEDKRELIQSATYFVSLRREHMAEVLRAWDEILKDIPLEIAEILLNEFLSPKFTLLEFEYRNLSKAGRAERDREEKDATLSEIWQKHILGKVLTDNEENESSVSITIDEKDDGETDVTKATVKGTKDGETSDKLDDADLTDADKEVARCAVEIFMIYKRVKWFIRYINVDKLDVCQQLKRTIRTGIMTFNRSFSVTWRVVNCLNYLEILESMRKDATNALTNVLTRMNRMLVEEKMGVFTDETGNLLKISHLFIDKYRENITEDELFRRGFGYLSRKLTMLKKDNTNGVLIMNVASHLANEESNISEVHEILKSVFNFEIVNI